MLARANRDPENTEWQRDLSVSYNKIADVLRDKGKADDALSHYQKSLRSGKTLQSTIRKMPNGSVISW